MCLCRIYPYSVVSAAVIAGCGYIIPEVLVAKYKNANSLTTENFFREIFADEQSGASVAFAWIFRRKYKTAELGTLMERCEGKYVCRSRVCRDSIENAFLSYALAEAMYDKNAN